MKAYKTINSFTQIPSPAQICSYILFALQILVFWIIIQNRYTSSSTRITMIVIYTISVVAHIIATVLASLSDPSDTFMIRYRNNRDSVKNSEIGHMLYCDICRSYVHLASRHCRSCGRCVQNFDHHCMWINNCVGGNNYKIFLVMIVLTFISMTMYIVSAALLWAEHRYLQFIPEMAVVWATSILVGIFLVLIFNLILLHIYLSYLGITTYEFIVRNKQNKQADRQKHVQHIEHQLTQEGLGNQKQNRFKQVKTESKHELGNSQQTQKQPERKIQEETEKKQRSNRSNSSEKNLQNSQYGEIKNTKVYPVGVLKQNVFQIQKQSRDSVSEKESLRISEFFAKNKSLSILVKSDVVKPELSVFPKTSKNTRQIRKIESRSSQ